LRRGHAAAGKPSLDVAPDAGHHLLDFRGRGALENHLQILVEILQPISAFVVRSSTPNKSLSSSSRAAAVSSVAVCALGPISYLRRSMIANWVCAKRAKLMVCSGPSYIWTVSRPSVSVAHVATVPATAAASSAISRAATSLKRIDKGVRRFCRYSTTICIAMRG